MIRHVGKGFVHEALSLFIDEDEVALLGLARDGGLEFVVARKEMKSDHPGVVGFGSARLQGHAKAVPGVALRGDGTFGRDREDGKAFGHHFHVVRKAARREHDGLGVQRFDALGRLHLDGRNLSVLHPDVDDLILLADVESDGIGLLEQYAQNFGTDGRAVAGTVTAGDRLTAAAPLAEAEVGAEIEEPFFRILGVFRKHLEKRRIVEVVTALHRVPEEDFRTVVRDARGQLLLGAGRIHAARGEVGVAAEIGLLFEHHGLGTRFLGHNARRQTGAARADDDHVEAFGLHAEGQGRDDRAGGEFPLHAHERSPFLVF